MAEALPAFRHAVVAQFGVIDGGPLNGWSFGLDKVVVQGKTVFLDVRATPPKWPFPSLVRLGENDFDALRDPRAVAKSFETKTLIAAAVDAVKYKEAI